MSSSPFNPEQNAQRFNNLFVGGSIVLILIFSVALVFVLRYRPDADRPWRIAITNWPGFDYLYLAQEKGFLREQNLNIKLVPVNSRIDMRTAFERGVIDGYTAASMDVIDSVQNSRIPARIVLITDYSSGGDEILTDPSITTVAELKGKRLGIESTTMLGHYMLQRALQNSGMDESSINLFPSSQTILSDLVRRNTLDGIITYEPFSTQIQAVRPLHSLFNSTQLPHEITDVVAVSPAMLEALPDLSKRLQRAWQSAMDYTIAHPDETHSILAQRYNISVPQYVAMIPDAATLDASQMQHLANTNALAENIRRTLEILGKPLLPDDEISRTIAVWFQQESR